MVKRPNLFWALVVGAVVALAFSGVAVAQDFGHDMAAVEIPGPEVDPGEMVEGFANAIGAGQWGLVVAFGLMFVVWVLRRIWPSIKTSALPWIAVAIGACSAGGAALIADPGQWLQALLAGVGAGLAAAGSWGLFGKKVLPKPPEG